VLPLFSINIAFNKVRLPGIVTFFMGIVNFALAIALALFTGWGYYGVAVAGAIVLTLKNTLFTPWYATRILGLSIHTFTCSMIPGIAATILIGTSAAFMANVVPLMTIVALALTGTVITLLYLAGVWKFVLNGFERGLFESYLPATIRRIIA